MTWILYSQLIFFMRKFLPLDYNAFIVCGNQTKRKKSESMFFPNVLISLCLEADNTKKQTKRKIVIKENKIVFFLLLLIFP